MHYVRERQERELNSLFAHRVVAEMFFKTVFKRGNFNLPILSAFCWSAVKGGSVILRREEP